MVTVGDWVGVNMLKEGTLPFDITVFIKMIRGCVW